MLQRIISITTCCFLFAFLFGFDDDQIANISKVIFPIVLRAESLIERRKMEHLGMPIIAIAGCSAVGKSEFAHVLKAAFAKRGIKAIIFKQDDFMNPLETIADHLIHVHLDHHKIHAAMQQIKNGERCIRKPKFDWKQRAVVYEDLDLTDADIILFEGTYTLSGPESYNFFAYSDIRLFIHAEEKYIVEWNWQRENSGKCGHMPRKQEKFDQDIAWDMCDYRMNILSGKLVADFIIEKNHQHDYSLVVREVER